MAVNGLLGSRFPLVEVVEEALALDDGDIFSAAKRLQFFLWLFQSAVWHSPVPGMLAFCYGLELAGMTHGCNTAPICIWHIASNYLLVSCTAHTVWPLLYLLLPWSLKLDTCLGQLI